MSILFAALMLVQSSQAAQAADKFALDLPTDTASASAERPAERVPAAPAGGFSLDTPIADLIADPRAKAILDRDVPGMSDDPNLPKFQTLSLRKLAPLSGGQMTPALLAKIGTDLAAIDGAPTPVKKVESRRSLPSGR
ncbi:hypothetical protein [Sphingomonas melonis]|uniref:Uncharacterized protein n=1 Tax=Sphingomonas melonis TaxID=152682 RepID=A0A7Y9K151_9SPHN|nr:hypothetical protein [Sphingomonas melonis]NYD89556.1 hypothetical protein [Sphingomonas melonis]